MYHSLNNENIPYLDLNRTSLDCLLKLQKRDFFSGIFKHSENLFILLQNWLLLGFLLPLQTYLALIQVNLSYLLSKGQSLPLMYGL